MPTVKRYLKSLSKPQLEQLVLDLAERNPQVHELLEVTADERKGQQVFERYCEHMAACFAPPPDGVDLATVQMLLQDYSRVGNLGELAMLLIEAAMLGTRYARDFGAQSDDYYGVMAECFAQSLGMAKEIDMVHAFRVPADAILHDAAVIGHPFRADIRATHRRFFGPSTAQAKAGRGARSGSKAKAAVQEKGKVVQMPTGQVYNNPFGATAPNELVCIESRALPVQGYAAWMFVAMDACSRFAFHYHVRSVNSPAEYAIFISELLKKHPELHGAKLALDLAPEMGPGLTDLFPQIAGVVCDREGVAEVTQEFHTALLAHMGGQGREN